VKTKKIGALAVACSLAVAAQSQTIIDPLTGSLAGYTTTAVLDNSAGAGQGVSFTAGVGGLAANYAGTGASAEQSLFLAPASSFSQTFAVGDTLSVNTSFAATGPTEDFGLAISAANPVAAGAGNGYNSRTLFDYAAVSLRPSQNALRVSTSINGTLTTGNGVIGFGGNSAANVTSLYVSWVSADVFDVGYSTAGGQVLDEAITFEAGSTIGSEIGFYGDLRGTGTSLGSFSDLTITPTPTPEPSTLALCSLGLAGLATVARRKK